MIERQPNTEYILSLSYGKDSIACLFAIEQLGWPLDRIVHAEVWATDTIPADLPPMVEFKAKADAIIKERWGIEVEHVFATDSKTGLKRSYEDRLYAPYVHRPKVENHRIWRGYGSQDIYGFPSRAILWCNSQLKVAALSKGKKANSISYLGIAADEPERILRHTKPGYMLPLVAAGWDEKHCRQLCEENDLLSPIYTTATRGGCWFCHNQGVDQLRLLRKTYPEYWELMLKWDNDSPVTFKTDGHTVHDYDARFAAEDAGLVPADRNFRWEMIDRKIIKPRVELPGQITMEEFLRISEKS